MKAVGSSKNVGTCPTEYMASYPNNLDAHHNKNLRFCITLTLTAVLSNDDKTPT
jgi:hypothetical protein